MLCETPELDYIKLNYKGEAYMFSLSGAKKIMKNRNESDYSRSCVEICTKFYLTNLILA